MDNIRNKPEEDRLIFNLELLMDLISNSMKILQQSTSLNYENEMAKLNLYKAGIKFLGSRNITENFIKYSHEDCWDQIKNKDENFFLQNAQQVFASVPSSTIDSLKLIFTSVDKNGETIIDEDYKNNIWKTLHNMIKISIKYVHRVRKEKMVNSEKYDNFLPEINLLHHAQNWNFDDIVNEIRQYTRE